MGSNIEVSQTKGLLKLMKYIKKYKAENAHNKMINGVNASYSKSLYFVDEDGRLIYEKASKRLVDIVKI